MIYGVGIIDGEKIADHFNRDREMYLHGVLTFGERKFIAASGLRGRYWSVPFGTYTLTPQSTGWIIENMYQRLGIAHRPGLERVWNVGAGEHEETCVGVDPACKRTRAEIQVHCEPRLVTQGCIALGYDDFTALARLMHASPEKLDIVVHPVEPHFRIVHRVPLLP